VSGLKKKRVEKKSKIGSKHIRHYSIGILRAVGSAVRNVYINTTSVHGEVLKLNFLNFGASSEIEAFRSGAIDSLNGSLLNLNKFIILQAENLKLKCLCQSLSS